MIRIFNNLKFVELKELFKDAPVFDVSGLAHTGAYATGNQEKWVLPDKRLILKAPYYECGYLKDYLVEQLAYQVGHQLGFNVAKQFVCWIVDDSRRILGTASRFGLNDNEDYSTFYRIVGNYPRVKKVLQGTPSEVFWGIRDSIADCCGFNASAYLFEILCLDLLMGNTDRHLNNFGVGYSHSKRECFSPEIFDVGFGLFEGVETSGFQGVDKLAGLLHMKPYSRYTPRDIAQSILPGIPKRIWCAYNWEINMEGLVFPSEISVRYFIWIAGVFGIRLKGVPVVGIGTQDVKPVSSGVSRGAHNIPMDCTLMYKDTPLLKIVQGEKELYPTLIADATKYSSFPLEFRIQERSLNINFATLKTFFRFRGIPDMRQNKDKVYEAWGASSFDSLGEKSRYLCVDDHYWIKYSYDDVTYKDVKIRD